MRQETRHPDLEQCGLAGEVLSLSRFSTNETPGDQGKTESSTPTPQALTQPHGVLIEASPWFRSSLCRLFGGGLAEFVGSPRQGEWWSRTLKSPS